MARFKAPQTSDFPYHITARTPNRVRFPIPLGIVWEVFQEELYLCHKKYNFEALSFVLMPNHFHLMARTQKTPLGIILNDLMRDTSIRINKASGRINQNWGETAYRCHIPQTEYFFNVYKYIYQNPVRAKLCLRVEDYHYSTLHGLLGQQHLFIPLVADETLFHGSVEHNLNWLNQKTDEIELEKIRKGLTYREFRWIKGTNPHFKKRLKVDTPPTRK